MGIPDEGFLCRTALIDSHTGELEVNFGEYDFVYPDGEIDTKPTSGESLNFTVTCLIHHHH